MLHLKQHLQGSVCVNMHLAEVMFRTSTKVLQSCSQSGGCIFSVAVPLISSTQALRLLTPCCSNKFIIRCIATFLFFWFDYKSGVSGFVRLQGTRCN